MTQFHYRFYYLYILLSNVSRVFLEISVVVEMCDFRKGLF